VALLLYYSHTFKTSSSEFRQAIGQKISISSRPLDIIFILFSSSYSCLTFRIFCGVFGLLSGHVGSA